MSIKKDICIEYLKRFKRVATKTLATKIYNENQEVFRDIEDVRGRLRYIRGNSGNFKKGFVEIEFRRDNGVSGNPFKLPESEAPDWAKFYIPRGNDKILLLSDIHLPYHSVEAITVAINYANKREKCNTLILNGDILDFYQASSFVRDPRKKKLSEEFAIFKDFISKLYFSLGEPKVYFKQGNHEERFERYLFLKAPELLDIDEFKLNILLEFGKYGIEYIDKKRIIKAGKLSILHGHEFGKGFFSPVNPARGLYMRSKESAIAGNNHQTSEHTEPSLSGKIITTWSMGCLCELNPEYMPINKWNHGFAFVETDGEDFRVHNKRIYKGTIM